MRRITSTVAMMAGVTLLAAACSGGGGSTSAEESPSSSAAAEPSASESAPPVRGDEELVIWTDALKLDAVRAVADQFAEDNGITVGVQAIVNTRTDFITANAAGNGPDVVVGAHDWIGQLVQNGAIDPLQLSAADLGGYAENAIQAVTYDGQIYGLPYGVEALGLYCNKAYAPDTYASLDDVIAAGQAAVDAGQVETSLNVAQGDVGDAYHMQPILTSMGGYLFGQNPDGTYNPEDLGLASPGGLAAAQKIFDLGEQGSNVLRRSISGDNSIALFAEGRAACLISGPWALADVREGLGEDGYTLQPIPGFAGQQPAQPFLGAQAFYVAANGQNKTFAQEFVTNGVNNAEGMTTMYELANLPPALTEVRQSIAADNPDFEVFAQAADNGNPMPAVPAMAEVWAPLGQAYSAIIGGADPASTMQQAQDTIAAAIAAS
ncbi:sugar ABC transporter substrate-binding protein [Cellulomonas marina]|uniref:Arabinogalactan oligomer / maltooligosaccharide transport system substrate-binding protein n=1 Tax=Cellulomonas marina TaxID=988821 RepID=A0A1I0VVV9_9CELL|nr:maltose ABC transporter substrate-binding protein [Cellulomonas marina]GIG27508.1 sugar ABC transporter substrate-binding protein [Cellulomonas marina]SFA80589.1 arabinogalactan oligomer / maltooligosaccharide transport system substrate-binding protein [Cellulomonas marina]